MGRRGVQNADHTDSVQLAARLPGSKLCRMLLLVSTEVALLEDLGDFCNPFSIFDRDWA